MEMLVKEGLIPKTEVGKLEFCESCVLGKSHKQSFPTAKHTSKCILEYVIQIFGAHRQLREVWEVATIS